MSRGTVEVSPSQTGGTTTHQLRHIRTRQSVREHSLVHDEVEVVWKRVVPQGYNRVDDEDLATAAPGPQALSIH